MQRVSGRVDGRQPQPGFTQVSRQGGPGRRISQLNGQIGWSHGKDTTLYPDRIAVRGVLDHTFPPTAATSSWHFSAVGDGHDNATWTTLLAALQAAGHDGVVSIEHEDPSLAAEESIARSARALAKALSL